MTRRVAMISEHASPVALLGGVDAGGQNVYVDAVSRGLVAHGYETDVFTVRGELAHPRGRRLGGRRSRDRDPGRCRRSAAERRALAAHAGVPERDRRLRQTRRRSVRPHPWEFLDVRVGRRGAGIAMAHPDGADLSRDRCHQAARARRGRYQPHGENRGREGRRADGRSPDRPMPGRTRRASG